MKKLHLKVPTRNPLSDCHDEDAEITMMPLDGYQATEHFMVHRGLYAPIATDMWQLTHIPTLYTLCGLALWPTRKKAVEVAVALEAAVSWDFCKPLTIGQRDDARNALNKFVCCSLHCSGYELRDCITSCLRDADGEALDPIEDVSPKAISSEVLISTPSIPAPQEEHRELAS
jgi:hypothetical protein